MAWKQKRYGVISGSIAAVRSDASFASKDDALDQLASLLANEFELRNPEFNRSDFLIGAGCRPPVSERKKGRQPADAEVRPSAIAEFVAAQRNYAQAESCVGADGAWQAAMIAAEERRQAAFQASAIAASRALGSGRTLQELAEANRDACGDLIDVVPKGTLYVSVEAVAYHALTGDLLRKPLLSREPAIVPTRVQALLVKVKRRHGTQVVRQIIANASNQQDAVEGLMSRCASTERGSCAPNQRSKATVAVRG